MNSDLPKSVLDAVDGQNSPFLDEHDLLLLRNVDQSLAEATQLKRWWVEKDAAQSFAQEFNLIQSFNHPSRGTGFFDSATLNGKSSELMGVVQEMQYDRPDIGATAVLTAIRDQLREFVMQYFMRVSDFRRPEAAVQRGAATVSRETDLLSWCPRSQPNWQGFGYTQHYYKLKDSDKIGKFSESERYAIIDLRELGKAYEWIVIKVRIFDFNLTFRLFGPNLPAVSLPLKEESYLILHKDFIVSDDSPGNRELYCEYGFGYGILRLNDADSDILAYGPGHFRVGFQTINFQMLPDGRVRAKLVFVVNRPEQLVRVPLDPVRWGFAFADLVSLGMASRAFAPLRQAVQTYVPSLGNFDPLLTYAWLANQLTDGEAERQFCISKEQLEKEMLVQHFMQHYEMIVGSLLTWRQISDWRDKKNLPSWIVHGMETRP